jgi:hypothetical protein
MIGGGSAHIIDTSGSRGVGIVVPGAKPGLQTVSDDKGSGI